MQKGVKYKRIIIISVFAAILLSFLQSCEEDIEVFSGDPYAPIVYCLLDPFDTVQYVRLSKSYVIDRGTNSITSEPDSLIYPGDVIVSLERWNNGQLLETIEFEKISGIEKDKGNFPGGQNILYRCFGKIYPENKYKLYLYFENSELFSYAEADMVGKLNVIDPFPVPQRQITLTDDMDYTIRWEFASQAWIYQPIVRFNYDEIFGTDTIRKSFDWKQRISQPDFIETDYLSMHLDGLIFYNELVNQIEEDPGVERRAVDFSFLFWYGGLELRFYAKSIGPSSGVLQEKPSYTNFNNCEGIFSSRSVKEITGVQLSEIFVDSIADGRFTRHLGFVNSEDSLNIN